MSSERARTAALLYQIAFYPKIVYCVPFMYEVGPTFYLKWNKGICEGW